MSKPLCIVAGVGPGNGLALCHKFLDEGYRVAILARNQERLEEYASARDDIYPFACDLSQPDSINAVFAEILTRLGAPKVVVYNAGSGLFGPPLVVKQDDFELAWRINALGLLTVAQAVAPAMIDNGGGSLLITGATASLRGGENFAAFSSAKGAQRNLAQSLARSLGKQGVHVALVVIDGVVDMPRTRELMADKDDSFFMQPKAIAEAYYALSQQSSSAWTFELDLRSSSEAW